MTGGSSDENLWDAHNHAHELLATAVRDTRARADSRVEDAAPEREVVLRWEAHVREHHLMEIALDKALASVDKAIVAALDAVNRERTLHAEAHGREHILQNQALEKAEHASEVRFAGVNEFREQLRDQASRLASAERVDNLQRETDRRFEELRLAITNLEKGDVKSEGKSLGQGATIAAIVGTVGFAATFLGLIIIVANLLTAKP